MIVLEPSASFKTFSPTVFNDDDDVLMYVRFLKILQVVVLEPSASFKTFSPTVLNDDDDVLMYVRFLKILQVIVLEPSASFKTFSPTVLNICLHHVNPVLNQVTISYVNAC